MPPASPQRTAAPRARPRRPVERVAGPVATPKRVEFFLAGFAEADGVRLEVDFALPGSADFRRVPGGWALRLSRPEVDRFEYQLTVRRGDHWYWMIDPGNPRTVPNPFGEKSEVLFPDYVQPSWLGAPGVGDLIEINTPAGTLDEPVPMWLWSPPDLPLDFAAPVLLAHDGSDMADRGSLLRWAARLRTPARVALLDPPIGFRDRWYGADIAYTDHVAGVLLAELGRRVAMGPVVALGASLGAVGMLLLQRRHPHLVQALALQSGSFFTAELDPQEAAHSTFARVCAFVQGVGEAAAPGVPTLLTCGAAEENRANNVAMAKTLSAQGYRVDLRLARDAHTMIGWRDSWYPGLDELMAAVATTGAGAPAGGAQAAGTTGALGEWGSG